jgi:hypothetical protein
MSNLVILFFHFLATLARLLGPGAVRFIVAESLILKHGGNQRYTSHCSYEGKLASHYVSSMAR